MIRIFHFLSVFVVIQILLVTTAASSGKFAIVSNDTIYPGQIIKAENLKAVELIREPTVRYRFVTRFEEIVGLQASRTILPGRFIRLDSAQNAPLIKAGTPTRVLFQGGGLSISVLCVPLSDGVVGQSIRVRNPTSGKIVTARVMKDGTLTAKKL